VVKKQEAAFGYWISKITFIWKFSARIHGIGKLKFVKIEGQCGHTNLIPVTEVFHVYENIKCEK
jgi:hypothetical protein